MCASVGSSERAWASTQGKAGGKCLLARGDFRSEEQQLSIWSYVARPWQGKEVKHLRYHWSQLVRLECTMGWICVFSCLGIDVCSFSCTSRCFALHNLFWVILCICWYDVRPCMCALELFSEFAKFRNICYAVFPVSYQYMIWLTLLLLSTS